MTIVFVEETMADVSINETVDNCWREALLVRVKGFSHVWNFERKAFLLKGGTTDSVSVDNDLFRKNSIVVLLVFS